MSGPAARASGVDLDLRLQLPYLAYRELAGLIAPPVRRSGDAQSRLALLAEEMTISASLIIACIDRLEELPGPVSVKLGKIIRVPEGEAYSSDRGTARHRRCVSGLPRREDSVAAQAADAVIQQHLQPGAGAGRGTH